jgi:hypothetical protein
MAVKTWMTQEVHENEVMRFPGIFFNFDVERIFGSVAGRRHPFESGANAIIWVNFEKVGK